MRAREYLLIEYILFDLGSNLVLMNIVEEAETNLDTIDLWWPSLCCGAVLYKGGCFCNIPTLHLLDASSTLPISPNYDNQVFFQILSCMSLGLAK